METHENVKTIDGENPAIELPPSSTGGGVQSRSLLGEVTRPIASAVRGARRNWRALVACFGVYVLWLLTLWTFFTTGEASFGQVALTFALMLLAPALFLLLQAMILDPAGGVESWRTIGPFLRRSLKLCGKLALISLPLIICAALTFFALGKIEARIKTADAAKSARQDGDHIGNSNEAARVSHTRSGNGKTTPQRINWPQVLLSALRYLLLIVAAPLALIHLWVASARGGALRATMKNAGGILRRAFAPRSVIIYTLGLLMFGVVPHLIIVTPTRVQNDWLEVTLIGMRLALALALVFGGWVLTLRALAATADEGSTTIIPER